MSSGERPIGATKGKQSDTEALCQPPPPPLLSACPARLLDCDAPVQLPFSRGGSTMSVYVNGSAMNPTSESRYMGPWIP